MFSQALACLLSRFRREQSGNVAMIFALATIPLIGVIGAAIDYAGASDLRTRLQQATDAADLQLCQLTNTPNQTQLQTAAQKSLTGMLPQVATTITAVSLSNNPRTVTLSTAASFETRFVKILGSGFASVDVTAKAVCSAGQQSFEIALVLDTTGSMANTGGGTSKIAALRNAATSFVNAIFDNAALTNVTKISVVPFAAAVAVDPSTYRNAAWVDRTGKASYHWQNVNDPANSSFTNRLDIFTKLKSVTRDWDWAGCFESLPYPLNVRDGSPTSANKDSYYVPMFAPDESGDGGTTSHCRTSSRYGCTATESTPNSYIDDATSKSGCNTALTEEDDRMGRACKYVAPTDASTRNGIGPNYMCTSNPLLRLSNVKSAIQSQITALQASGNTNIHEGLMWGWRTLSPSSVFADGAAYNAPNNTKVMIVMTDGANTWGSNTGNSVTGSTYSAYGYLKNVKSPDATNRLPTGTSLPRNESQARAAMDALTLEACTNAKAAGIQVYTIGFSVSSDPIDAQGLALLQKCASSSNTTYVANNSSDIVTVFNQIAQGIGNVRLTR